VPDLVITEKQKFEEIYDCLKTYNGNFNKKLGFVPLLIPNRII